MSAITPEQWAIAGEHALHCYFEAEGLPVTPELTQEARETAVWIATGHRLPATPDRA